MNEIVATGKSSSELSTVETEEFVTFFVEDQLFGIPVLKVQDILTPDSIASIPLAPPEIAGSINLRGRIVTVIDVRTRLGLPNKEVQDGKHGMGVTVEHHNDLYTFLVDKIGEVINVKSQELEKAPSTLDQIWRDYSLGVYRLEAQLMMVLDVEKLLDFENRM
ncbi:MAG: chemotaxis protein CheW [Alphaproteobacteria bacterium]|nr:chemotaxis protein CheW [Rhodospirillales bacterium]MCW9044896.1 chemotaxis protein CheW [Alphaproteobacteria bacterium]